MIYAAWAAMCVGFVELFSRLHVMENVFYMKKTYADVLKILLSSTSSDEQKEKAARKASLDTFIQTFYLTLKFTTIFALIAAIAYAFELIFQISFDTIISNSLAITPIIGMTIFAAAYAKIRFSNDRQSEKQDEFPNLAYRLGKLVRRTSGFWLNMADLEDTILQSKLTNIHITKPIYVTSLARSGTTILLETLASAKETASLQYRDYPFYLTPWFTEVVFNPKFTKNHFSERAHKDRILVSPQSPEAMEEPMWMTFFPNCHQDQVSHVLGSAHLTPEFEKFYTSHAKKVLHLRNGNRYLAKGNYNISRLEILISIFPDAKFLVPVRNPMDHIASLVKQQDLFTKLGAKDPRTRSYLTSVGHLEFGDIRTAINLGYDEKLYKSLLLDWVEGREIAGWAKYWSYFYEYVDLVAQEPKFRQSIAIVRYEDLCQNSLETLGGIFEFCEISVDKTFLAEKTKHLSMPDYYSSKFTPDDEELIRSLTQKTAEKFGYPAASIGSS